MPCVTQPAASESRAAAKDSVAHAPTRSADARFNFAMVVQQQDSATRGGRISNDRTSWSKAAAIRRGQLKISAPLQWSGAAGSNAMESRSQHVDGYGQDARSSTQQPASDGIVINGDRPVTSVSSHPAAQDQHVETKQQRPKTSTQDVKSDRPLQPYTTPRDSVMYDTSTSSESPKSTQSKKDTTGTKRRKSVAIRSVIRRMFGKKDRDDEKEPMLSNQSQSATTHNHQRSVGHSPSASNDIADQSRMLQRCPRNFPPGKSKKPPKSLKDQSLNVYCPCQTLTAPLEIPFGLTCHSQ